MPQVPWLNRATRFTLGAISSVHLPLSSSVAGLHSFQMFSPALPVRWEPCSAAGRAVTQLFCLGVVRPGSRTSKNSSTGDLNQIDLYPAKYPSQTGPSSFFYRWAKPLVGTTTEAQGDALASLPCSRILLVVSCPWIVVNCSSCEAEWSQEWPMSPFGTCHLSIIAILWC